MNNKEWRKLKKAHYRTNTICQTDDGTIDFSMDDFQKLETHGIKLTYDEYLDIMRDSGHNVRHYYEMCFYAGGGFAECKGEILRFSEDGQKVVFRRIFVSGMAVDGECFDGKEDHVWMDAEGFKQYVPGNCLSFTAEVYRYLKTGNGKQIDFALRNPEEIKQVESYTLPSDKSLLMQSIDSLVCEACMLSEQCYGQFCMNERWREEMRKEMFKRLQDED